ncbi:MAG TPA: TonB-dependent receptor [Woeseiaceae bacterium]|nr:TonB-dependent receptor [Woeseiaceae bacterium]
MFTSNRLQKAVRLALGVSAGTLAASYAPGALAQDPAADEAIEEIVTTGSRIKRADLDSASPVTVIRREDIVATGLTDVGNLIQRMPSMSGSPIGTTTNNGGNGSVQIDLRGMGVDRTVTLVNGHRTVDQGDYQTIPQNMIERVEILKDGASAVYGADAVAGVVNIITRTDFEGVEISAQNADFFDMDSGAQNSIGLLAGKNFEGGNIVFGAEYVNQEEAYQSDAPWDFFQTSYYIYPEGCEANLTAPYDGTNDPATSGCYELGSSRIPQSRLQFFQARVRDANGNPLPGDYIGHGLFHIGTPATAPYQAGTLTAGFPGTYNYAPVNYIQTPYERLNLYGDAHFDVTETVRFRASVRGNFRESAQELAPVPYTPGDPFYDGFFTNPVTGVTTAYSGISEDNYYLRQAIDAYNAANGTTLAYEPVIDARRRMIESDRRFEQDITQIQTLIGFDGTFNEIDWDVFYNTGYRSRTDVDLGQFSGARLSNALGPSADLNGDGQPECYADLNDPGTLIQGCVPLNLFGGGEVDPVTSQPTTTTLTQDMIDYIKADLTDTFVSKMTTAGFSFAGSAFELPGGELGWAAGYNYYAQEYTYSPDSGKQTGAVTGNIGARTDGSLYNNGVFGEVLLPLFDNGSQSINVKGGVRYDSYNAFDSETTYQLGVEVQAIESLKLRATYGTVFRAPTIIDLYGGLADNFPTYVDPCIPTGGDPLPPGCAQLGVQLDSQLRSREGGNPNLIPETGETFTAGVVWTPEFGNNDLSLTVDYWDIQIEDGISSLGVQFILEDCYERQVAASCALITRNADYSINQVLNGNLNVAEQGANGIDTELRWSMDSSIGQWQAALLWSHLLERTKKPSSIDDTVDLAGRYTDVTAQDGGGYATDKINYSVQWFRENFSIGYLGEYISGLDADTFCNCGLIAERPVPPGYTYTQVVDSQLYHDLVASYEFTQTGTRIAAGVTNLTDEEPPYIEIGFNATTEPSNYRMFGIGYYLRLTQTFE